MRTFVNATEEALAAVAEIVRLVSTKVVEPLVALDIETAPFPGLEGYPGTVVNDDGEFVRASKRAYLEFAQRKWAEAFDPALLAVLGLYVPRKVTGLDAGQKADAAWVEFLTHLEETPLAVLDGARWSAEGLSTAVVAAQNDLSALTAARNGVEAEIAAGVDGVRAQLAAVEARLRGQLTPNQRAQAEKKAQTLRQQLADGKEKGRKALETRLKRLVEAETAQSAEVSRLEGLRAAWKDQFEGGNERSLNVDSRLLRHIVRQGVERGVRSDPVRPGLDPFTSTVFLVQFTLRRCNDGELLSWIFNTHRVDLAVLIPALKLRATYIGANIKFDLKFLIVKLGRKNAPAVVGCTRINSRMLYLGLQMSHSLASCTERFLGVELSKEERNTFVGRRYTEPTPQQLAYAYTDTEVLFPLWDAQMKLAAERDQAELLQEFGQLSWVTALWEADGYALDAARWLEIAAEAGTARDAAAVELERLLVPDGCVPTTPVTPSEDDESEDEDARPDAVLRITQTGLVKQRLAQLLDLEVGSLQKDQRNLLEQEYRAKNGDTHPFFRLYGRWSKLAKQASTYGRRFLWNLHPLTGRIHPSFNIAGTDTGRYSGSAPNLLNIPAAKEEGDPDFRAAFRAPEGCYLLGADYEAMELRIAGNVTRDPVVRKMIESGADPHSFTAAMAFHIRRADRAQVYSTLAEFKYGTETLAITVFEVPDTWTTEQVAEFALTEQVVAAIKAVPKKTTRTVAKMVTFLWLFRGTPFTLAIRTGLPEEQCQLFFAQFEAVYETMSAEMTALAAGVFQNVIVADNGREFVYSSAYGNLRRYFELPDQPSRWQFGKDFAGDLAFYEAQKKVKRERRAIAREACNVPMQSGNAMITCKALNELVRRGRAAGFAPWLAVYDEIILLAHSSVPEAEVGRALRDVMLETANEYMTFIPAGAEPGTAGAYWRKS